MMRFVLLLGFVGSSFLQGQSNEASVDALEKAFQSFDYQRVIALSANLLSGDSSLSERDSLNIVEMQTVAYFSMGDMQGALNAAITLLGLNPQFQFDPARTSPKIIRFVDDVRTRLILQSQPALQPQQPSVNIDSLNAISRTEGYRIQSAQVIRNIALPGWGQWKRGEKLKGSILSTAFLSLAGATVWSIMDTRNKRKDYVNSTSLSDINSTYQNYNNAYRLRNGLISTTSLLWLYSQFSLLRSSPAQSE